VVLSSKFFDSDTTREHGGAKKITIPSSSVEMEVYSMPCDRKTGGGGAIRRGSDVDSEKAVIGLAGERAKRGGEE
jgi:hypothetical protein